MYARTDCTDAQTDRRAAYPGAECGSSYRGLTDQALAHTHTHTRTQIVRQADPGCHSTHRLSLGREARSDGQVSTL